MPILPIQDSLLEIREINHHLLGSTGMIHRMILRDTIIMTQDSSIDSLGTLHTCGHSRHHISKCLMAATLWIQDSNTSSSNISNRHHIILILAISSNHHLIITTLDSRYSNSKTLHIVILDSDSME